MESAKGKCIFKKMGIKNKDLYPDPNKGWDETSGEIFNNTMTLTENFDILSSLRENNRPAHVYKRMD